MFQKVRSFSHFSLESILLIILTISYHLSLTLGRAFGFFCLLFRLFSSNNFHVSVCKLHAFACRADLWLEGSQWVFGIRDFPYLKAGIHDLIARWGRDWGLKVCTGCGMRDAENSHRDYEMEKNLGRDDWIKEPHHAKNSFLTWPAHVAIVVF